MWSKEQACSAWPRQQNEHGRWVVYCSTYHHGKTETCQEHYTEAVLSATNSIHAEVRQGLQGSRALDGD